MFKTREIMYKSSTPTQRTRNSYRRMTKKSIVERMRLFCRQAYQTKSVKGQVVIMYNLWAWDASRVKLGVQEINGDELRA